MVLRPLAQVTPLQPSASAKLNTHKQLQQQQPPPGGGGRDAAESAGVRTRSMAQREDAPDTVRLRG